MLLSVIAFILSLFAILSIIYESKTNKVVTIIFGVVGLILSFISISNSFPRNVESNGIDYLGIIIAILAIIVTILLGLQMYNVFRLKNDAEDVNTAKRELQEFEKEFNEISKEFQKLKQDIDSIKEDFRATYDSIMDLEEKSKNALYVEDDGPDDYN